jgi:hypothetical protein
MKEQNTWPDPLVDIWNPSPEQKQTTEQLQRLWLSWETSSKLAALRADFEEKQVVDAFKDAFPWEDKSTEIAEASNILTHAKEQILQNAHSERRDLYSEISSDPSHQSEIQLSHTAAIWSSLWSIGKLWKDFIMWIWWALTDLKASREYLMSKADWIVTDSELDFYKIT